MKVFFFAGFMCFWSFCLMGGQPEPTTETVTYTVSGALSTLPGQFNFGAEAGANQGSLDPHENATSCAGEDKSREAGEKTSTFSVEFVNLPKQVEPGKEFELKMVLKNTTTEPLTFCKKPGFKISLKCRTDGDTEIGRIDGAGPRLMKSGHGELPEYSETDFVTLASGEEYSCTRSDKFPLEFKNEVEITCSFESKFKGEKIGKDAWTGKVETKSTVKLNDVPAVPPPQAPGDF